MSRTDEAGRFRMAFPDIEALATGLTRRTWLRLRMLYLDCLGRLLRRHSESGALERALDCGRQILELDPLREDIHREVIRLHVRNGQRALALQQYESCRTALQEELGVEPMEETRALCADLLTARVKPIPGKVRARIGPSLRTAAAKLDEARDALADALRIAESERWENK